MALIGGIGGGGSAFILILLVLAIFLYRKRRRKSHNLEVTMNMRSLTTQGELDSAHRLDDLVAMDKDILNEHQAPQGPAFGWGRRQYRPGSAPETNFLSPNNGPLYV